MLIINDVYEGIRIAIKSALAYNDLNVADFSIIQSYQGEIYNADRTKKATIFMTIQDLYCKTMPYNCLYNGKEYFINNYEFNCYIDCQAEKNADYYLLLLREYFFHCCNAIKCKDDLFNNSYNNNVLFLLGKDEYTRSFTIWDNNKYRVLPRLTLKFVVENISENKKYIDDNIKDIKIRTWGV